MIESFTDLIELLVLFTILIDFLFLTEAALSEFSNLHLIVAGVEKLTLILFDAHSQHFNLLGESLDLDGLENHNELQVLA